MQQLPAFIVIVDISGYTSFVKMHRTSMVHAEQIITDLMEAVRDQKEAPLELDNAVGEGGKHVAEILAEIAQLAKLLLRQHEARGELEILQRFRVYRLIGRHDAIPLRISYNR